MIIGLTITLTKVEESIILSHQPHVHEIECFQETDTSYKKLAKFQFSIKFSIFYFIEMTFFAI